MNKEEIIKIRKALGRTQVSMATIVGVTVTTWWRWEQGKSTPMPVFVEKLKKLQKYVGNK